MRLNKFIAYNSKYSRREADRLIKDGQVKIGRQVIKDFSYDVKKGDKIYVKSNLIVPKSPNKLTIVVYNKPKVFGDKGR